MNDPEFNLGWLTKLKLDIIRYHKLMGNNGKWPKYPHHPYMDIEYINLEFYSDLPESFLVVRLDEAPKQIVLLYPVPSSTAYSSLVSFRYLLGRKDSDGSWVMSPPRDVENFRLDTLGDETWSFLRLFPYKEDGRGNEFELDSRSFPDE